MADAVKAIRQRMQKEAPNELSGFERQLSGPAAMAIVTPAESHPFKMPRVQRADSSPNQKWVAGLRPRVSQRLVAGMRQRRATKLCHQNGEARSLSSLALLTALGWIGLSVFFDTCGITRPQCAFCSHLVPSASIPTIGAECLGKIAGRGSALPRLS